jgi:hypothetical protein
MPTQKIACLAFAIALLGAASTAPAFAQEKAAPPKDAKPATAASSGAAQPNEADMMAKMMELGKPGENHKLLADMAGNWNYQVKFWMVPGMPAHESSGTAVRKSIMDGRYSVMDVSGKIPMPGPDGKMTAADFKGMSLDAYDNVKGKFVSTWIDNMGTGVAMSEGTYDPATKTFTYFGEMEMMPGMKTKTRQTTKMPDKDHLLMEWFEAAGGGPEAKTMEINYTRQK